MKKRFFWQIHNDLKPFTILEIKFNIFGAIIRSYLIAPKFFQILG